MNPSLHQDQTMVHSQRHFQNLKNQYKMKWRKKRNRKKRICQIHYPTTTSGTKDCTRRPSDTPLPSPPTRQPRNYSKLFLSQWLCRPNGFVCEKAPKWTRWQRGVRLTKNFLFFNRRATQNSYYIIHSNTVCFAIGETSKPPQKSQK